MENIDQNTMNNIKKMVDNGDLNGAISQISPEMIQNFSKMFANAQANNSNSSSSSDENNNQQFDVNQFMKLANALNSQNNDPRNNLLNSLKPYLRDGKKAKLDNYINLMNMSKIADIMKNNSKQEN